MSKPNLPGLIEDPTHPDFKHQLVDADGVAWCAMWDEGAKVTSENLIWERLAISGDRFRAVEACVTKEDFEALGPA